MLDYSMLWVHSLADEVILSDDVDLAQRHYPMVLQLMGHLHSFANPQTGLLDLPRQPWSSTAYIDTYGYNSRYGQSAALNAFYVETFLRAAQIADIAGHPVQAASWRAQASEIRDSLNAALFQPLEGFYLSAIYAGGPVTPTIHAQAWPLVYGIAPPVEQTRLADALLEMLPAQPPDAQLGIYGMYWVLGALGEAGYVSEALDVIRLYYGYMLDRGATTWWETFSSGSRPDASYSHGWGGAPTWFLTTYVLGAQRLGPDTWRVEPSLSGLDYASGVLPLDHGVLDVHWERVSCSEFHLHIQSPINSNGQVLIRQARPGLTLFVNGEPVEVNSSSFEDNASAWDMTLPLTLHGGTYEFVVRSQCIP
jgi:alpha-L-rhamnosidase